MILSFSFKNSLKDIQWKDINFRFKNKFEKTEEYVLKILKERGFDPARIVEEVDHILKQIESLHIEKLGPRVKPPTGY